MKVIHVLKRIETIDQDIKELRKLEKSLEKNKSFTAPIFMTIEKQVNILLGERIKLLELEVKNPPETLRIEIEGDDTAEDSPIAESSKGKKKAPKKEAKPAKAAKATGKPAKTKEPLEVESSDDDDDFPIPMLTQDLIDKRINQMEKEPAKAAKKPEETAKNDSDDDTSVKLLDLALEKGTLDKKVIQQEKEKRRIRFFRDNFPGGEY